MSTLTELYDKLENMERGTEAYEAIQIEIDRIKNIQDQEAMVAFYVPKENGKIGANEPF